MRRIFRLMQTGKVDPTPMTTHEFDFDEIERAFRMMGSKEVRTICHGAFCQLYDLVSNSALAHQCATPAGCRFFDGRTGLCGVLLYLGGSGPG